MHGNDPKTLIDMLKNRAEQAPHQAAFVFDQKAFSYAQIQNQCLAFAAHLQKLGIRNKDRVIIVLQNGPDFFHAFYGTLNLGAIAIPLYAASPPQRIANIASVSKASAIVLADSFSDSNWTALKALEIPIIQPKDIDSKKRPKGTTPPLPLDVAFVQYTSGSTGDPKGVQLTHAGLLTNIRQMIQGMEINGSDRFVSWLPVCHDMGLILMTMVPFYLGLPLFLLPTSLAKVNHWLQTISNEKATFTAAPDFAYRLCLRYIQDPNSYNLNSLRVALNAAEPVRASTICQFEKRFGLENVVSPAYGLAEATVGVSMWPSNQKVKVDRQGLVSVGQPFPEIQLKILDKDNRPLPTGTTGQIAISSPANTKGYLFNPGATQKLFLNANAILSGDLGYIDESGDLFIVGRQKNVIISAGRTVAPQEVEEIADGFHGVRLSAAIGIQRPRIQGEQIYVFVELKGLRKLDSEQHHECALQLMDHFRLNLGFRPARVYLCKPRTIPRTPNGKVQHSQLKERYQQGILRELGQLIYPEF